MDAWESSCRSLTSPSKRMSEETIQLTPLRLMVTELVRQSASILGVGPSLIAHWLWYDCLLLWPQNYRTPADVPRCYRCYMPMPVCVIRAINLLRRSERDHSGGGADGGGGARKDRQEAKWGDGERSSSLLPVPHAVCGTYHPCPRHDTVPWSVPS